MPHNYSEVLPALLVLLVSYARMIVFDNLGEDWFKFCIVVCKSFFFEIPFPILFVNDIFASFWATFGSSLSFEYYLCLS